MYVTAHPLLDHTMPGSKLHSAVQWKGTAQFHSSCSFMSVAVVFLHVGVEAAHCTSLMPVKVLHEQGTINLFSGSTLFFPIATGTQPYSFSVEASWRAQGLKPIPKLLHGRINCCMAETREEEMQMCAKASKTEFLDYWKASIRKTSYT